MLNLKSAFYCHCEEGEADEAIYGIILTKKLKPSKGNTFIISNIYTDERGDNFVLLRLLRPLAGTRNDNIFLSNMNNNVDITPK